MPMIAMTTRSSTRVKPRLLRVSFIRAYILSRCGLSEATAFVDYSRRRESYQWIEDAESGQHE